MGAGASALMHLDRLQGMDDGKRTTEVHQFRAHGDTWIQAVYTNEGRTVESILAMYLEWLKDEEFRFVGLDLEYDLNQSKIAVMQIAMKEHVLVFHMIRCKDNVSGLWDFLRNHNITFVGVDIRKDSRLLDKEWLYIPPGKHVDLQDMFRIEGCGYRAGMAAMAAKLIHPKYAGMKEKFVKDIAKRQGHDYWEWKPLSEMNLEYAAIDGYVTYELCRIITVVNKGQKHLTPICPSCSNNEGSSSIYQGKRRRGCDN